MSEVVPQNAVLYCRISDARNGSDDGVRDQEADLRKRAAALGWGVLRVEQENDTSAFTRRKVQLPTGGTAMRVVRPKWRTILDDLAAGRADGLLAVDLDRVARDPRDLEDLIDVVESRTPRIPVESLTGSLRLATDADVTMARVQVAIANKSSRDTARRVARARERLAITGRYAGGSRSFGYERDGVTVRESEAAEIRQIADAFLSGASLNSLTQDLRDRGVPTVTGARWATRTVRTMLLSPRIAGIAMYKGREMGRGQWEPILPEQTWRAVVERLNDPTRRTSPGNTPRWLGSLLYLCGKCDDGTTMRVSAVGGSKRDRIPRVPSYRCREHGHLTRSAVPLDRFVEKVIIERLSRPDAGGLLDEQRPGVDVDKLRAEANALRTRIEALADNLEIDEVTLARRDRALRAKLAEVEHEMAAADGHHPLAGIAGRPDAGAIWGKLNLARRRAILDALMVVTVYQGRRGKRQPDGSYFDPTTVDITWRTS